MTNSELNVVLGATGGVGATLVRALANDGRHVRAVSRGGNGDDTPGVEHLAADIEDPHAAQAAMNGADVVYMAAAPAYYDWHDRFEPMIANVIDGAEKSGAKLVMVDNFYMYGPDVEDIREDSPQDPPGHKGRARKAVAQQLLAAQADGRLPVTIARLSDYYGPAGPNSAATITLLKPALQAKTLRWAGHPSLPHTLHYLPDVARGLVVLGDAEQANGQAWILPAAPPLTGTELVEMVKSLASSSSKWSRPPKATYAIAGLFNKMMRELKETTYQFDQRYVSHDDKFLDAFGPFEVTPHEQALAETLEWYRSHDV